jgi:sugar lactone lactonase YvrE
MIQEIWAYKFDSEHGDIADRRLLASTIDQPGQPDGSTVDAEGFIWNAQWDGWRLVRYAPDGRIDRIVELPVQKPTSVIFGGPDLSVLFVTTAIWDLKAEALQEQPLAGALLALDVGVAGLPETRFAG